VLKWGAGKNKTNELFKKIIFALKIG